MTYLYLVTLYIQHQWTKKMLFFFRKLDLWIRRIHFFKEKWIPEGKACFICDMLLCPPDSCISLLLEVALSENEEQKPFDCTLRPDLSVLVDLALGSSKEPASSLWVNMQDYAISKGLLHPWNVCSGTSLELTVYPFCSLWQTGTTRLWVMSPCWTQCPSLLWLPYWSTLGCWARRVRREGEAKVMLGSPSDPFEMLHEMADEVRCPCQVPALQVSDRSLPQRL